MDNQVGQDHYTSGQAWQDNSHWFAYIDHRDSHICGVYVGHEGHLIPLHIEDLVEGAEVLHAKNDHRLLGVDVEHQGVIGEGQEKPLKRDLVSDVVQGHRDWPELIFVCLVASEDVVGISVVARGTFWQISADDLIECDPVLLGHQG